MRKGDVGAVCTGHAEASDRDTGHIRGESADFDTSSQSSRLLLVMVMIGDSSFFWNTNLEMEESHIEENVEFLKWLLSGMRKDA